MHKQPKNSRILLFSIAVFVVVSLVIYRLLMLTYVQHDSYAKIARAQQQIPSTLLAGRGSIYASSAITAKNELLAANQNTDQGIRRYYPQQHFAGHVLGFVGYQGHDRVGQYGIEGYYDEALSANRSALTSSMSKTSSVSRDGFDLVLTLDETVQAYAESALDALLKKWSAQSGTIIVQEPATGAILAMVSSPGFDPNDYRNYTYADFINPATQQIFEPGSSFKAFTMAAAIDAGVVTPDTTYNDTGEVTIGTYTIKNYNEKANGIQTMRQVLEHSLNTGTIFAQRKTGNDAFLNYVEAFGFSAKTGVDLAGEVVGNVKNLYTGRAVNFATASFGQGIAVTPLQLINAYSAIANGGRLMKPYLVKEIIHPDGKRVVTVSKILDAPISEKSATQMKSMLVGVVDKGFDKAGVKGYDVAGKTGTAQIPDGKGGYLEDKQFIHNFVGFAPAYSPRFTILIKIDKPKGITFAADSLSPAFGDMTQYLLRYYKIAPTR